MSEKLELEAVLNSKVFVRNGSVDFKSPKEYLMPFIDQVSKLTDKITAQVSGAVENAEEGSGQLNTAYGRVLVEAQMPDLGVEGFTGGVIGMVYGLDTGRPIAKVYSGQVVYACTNLCIFGHNNLFQQEILAGISNLYQETQKMVEEKEKELELFKVRHDHMVKKELKQQEIDEVMGQLLRKAITKKYNITLITNSAALLNNHKSKYYATDGITTEWNIYNSITQGITDKVDILEKCTKTAILNDLFLN